MKQLSRVKRKELEKRRNKKRMLIFTLIISLLSILFIPSFALSNNTPKEEVVYVNLNRDGSVDAIYVVNSFDLTEDGQIIDYGDYTAFRRLTDSGEIEMENEVIRIDGKAGKLYYEGKLRENSIPWKFSIRYFLNNEEYSGKEIGGKSGSLEIKVGVDRNKDVRNEFFKHFTLQVGFSFDVYNCKEIMGDGATIANAGKYKQVTFTILPGKTAEVSVFAEVNDFEMEGISINAIPMNMDFNFEDDPDMTEKLKELKDGVAELDDGATEIRDGAGELKDGTKELKDGVDELNDGVFKLADGTGELYDNGDEFVDGVKELNDGVKDIYKGTKEFSKGTKDLDDGVSDLASGIRRLYSGSADLSGGLTQLTSQNSMILGGADEIFDYMIMVANEEIPGNPLTKENYYGLLNAMLKPMEDDAYSGVIMDIANITSEATTVVYGEITTENPEATPEEIAEIMNGSEAAGRIEKEIQRITGERIMALLSGNPSYVALYSLREQLAGYEQFYNGLVAYTSGVSSISLGAAELSAGLRSLRNGANELRDGTVELKDGAAELHDGVIELRDGVLELVDGSTKLQDGIIELNDGVIELKDGVIELFDGAVELHDGIIELYDGTVSMAEGTFKFRDKTKSIEKDLKDTIREKIDDMLGRNFKPISFVSEKNANIESVQFVMQTKAIDKPEITADATVVNKKLTFFDRLKALFGL